MTQQDKKEQRVLGLMLMDPFTINVFSALGLTLRDFKNEKNKEVYRSIMKAFKKNKNFPLQVIVDTSKVDKKYIAKLVIDTPAALAPKHTMKELRSIQ